MEILVTVFLISSGLTVLFLLQILSYMVYTYFALWKKKKKISLECVLDIAKSKSLSLPSITIVVPARNESDVITASIDSLMGFNYPRELFDILVVLDDKEFGNIRISGTTHDLVRQKEDYYNRRHGRRVISSTSVPSNFNGKYYGKIISKEIPSTKPRALNWGLKFVNEKTDIVGFYDADSRPDPDTLLYVAYKYLLNDGRTTLLQGSLIQTRNYSSLKILNKIYALAQGLTHEFFYPAMLKHLPFIGGTNFFISSNMLHEVKGFNRCSLSEDLDFGCRLYLNLNVWPEFMPYIATEQTPSNYRDYFNQRTRWSYGFFQVMRGILINRGSPIKRFYLLSMLIIYGTLPWITSTIVILSGFLMTVVLFFRGLNALDFVPPEIKSMSIFLNLIYLSIIFLYYHYAISKFYIPKIKSLNKLFFRHCELMLFPVAAILGGIPYTYGFISGLISKKPGYPVWGKTKRTKEVMT